MPAFSIQNVSLYIIAGGKSSRFGEDKASFVYKDKALIEHVRDRFSSLGEATVVAKAPRDFRIYQMNTIHDLAGEGPLAGISAALEHCVKEWIFIVPCDTLDFDLAWLDAFEGKEGSAIAFHDGKLWLPLFSAFHRSAIKSVLQNIDSENWSVRKLLDDLNAIKIPLPEDWDRLHRIDYKRDLKK